jgi:phosphoglucomutase
VTNAPAVDLSAPIGTVYKIGSSTVTIIDPFQNYLDTLKECFDFDQLNEFGKKEGFKVLFDGMHGAGGIFANIVHQLFQICTSETQITSPFLFYVW